MLLEAWLPLSDLLTATQGTVSHLQSPNPAPQSRTRHRIPFPIPATVLTHMLTCSKSYTVVSTVHIGSRWLDRGRTFLSKCNGSCPQLGAGWEGPSFSNRVPSPCSVVVQHSLEILRQGANDGLDIQAHPLQSFLLHRQVLAPGSYLQGERGEKQRSFIIASEFLFPLCH